MIADFEAIESNIFDHVIVGSGPAGMILAEKLKEVGSVLVIERGGVEDQADIGDDSYELDVTGLRYPDYGSRLATFGGTSNHWGGQSHPMDKVTFETSLGGHGWPIEYAEFARYLPEALKFLNLGEYPDAEGFAPISPFYEHSEHLARHEFQVSYPIVRIGDDKSIKKYVGDKGILLLLNTRVIKIDLDQTGRRVSQVMASRNGETRAIKANNYILACGGIENARLMLWSGSHHPVGNPLSGGPNELTGKYFMEHPHIEPFEIYFRREIDLRDTNWRAREGKKLAYAWRTTEEMIARLSLARFGCLCYNRISSDIDKAAFDEAGKKYFYDYEKYVLATMMMMFEQSPYESSQVRLSSKRDTLGMPIAELDWRISPQDYPNFRKTAVYFGSILSQQGTARVRLKEGYRSENWESVRLGAGNHHMGTTRMAHRPQDGVVDPDCKVFGLENMYVAGSSVFARGDYVNPTVNLVALSARLAAHLSKSFVETISPLTFGNAGNSNAVLTSGWSGIEDEGVWSDGDEAEIILYEPRQVRRIQIVGHAYGKNRVTVRIDEDPIFKGRTSELGRGFIDLKEPTLVKRIEFKFDNLTSPKKRGESSDSRELGLFIKRLDMK